MDIVDTELFHRWKLDKLGEIVDQFDSAIEKSVKERKSNISVGYTNIVVPLLAKSIMVLREIILLSAHGYPEGALMLTRSIYEQMIVLLFFDSKMGCAQFDEYVSDYLLDSEIKWLKSDIYYLQTFPENDADKTKLIQTKRELNSVCQRAHKRVDGDYWWAGVKSFAELSKYIGQNGSNIDQSVLNHCHYSYKRASLSLHANCLGNTLQLGKEKGYDGVITGPTIHGIGIPLLEALMSFGIIAEISCRILNIDFLLFQDQLINLTDFYHSQSIKEL